LKRWSLFLPDGRVALVMDPELARVREQECRRMLTLLTSTEHDEVAEDALRKQCQDLGIQTKARPPIQIASFEI
jgi:hypothetical protein